MEHVEQMNSKVAILLSTYNGEKYLREQLDSIFCQTYQNFVLYVRDDGSTDSTVSILKEYSSKFPNQMILFNDDDGNLGYRHSFFRLLDKVDSDYYAFCDQDDVWMPTKISECLTRLVCLEKKQQSCIVPCCVFSDMTVVDENLNLVDNSIWHYSYTNPEYAKDVYSLIVNTLPSSGCSLMINKAVKTVGLSKGDILDFLPGHDEWATFICSVWGEVDIIYSPLILYRRHSNNTSDAHTNSMHFGDIFKNYLLSPLHALKYISSKYILLNRLGIKPEFWKLLRAIYNKTIRRCGF